MFYEYFTSGITNIASIKKVNNGKWQVQVATGSVRKSKTFASKQAAKDWSAREEHKALTETQNTGDILFSKVLNIYATKVSSTKKSVVSEAISLLSLAQDPMAQIKIGDIKPNDVAQWRDRRMSEVKSSTVLRDWTFLATSFPWPSKNGVWLKKTP